MQIIMSDSARDDPTVTALLAMSEYFMGQRPQAVAEAARCLLAVLALRPVPRLEASVRLRLGLLLSEHTSCALEAKEQLEKAMLVAGTSGSLQEVRFHAASSLAALLGGQGQGQQARGLLRGKLEVTSHHPYWHIRLHLQLADLLSREGDVAGQLSALYRCADYCQRVGAGHTHLLATLARGAILLTHHNYSEAGSVLNVASTLLEGHRGPGLTLLRTFYLTIQVTHLLMAGQVKTAKPHLKQLQQCVQSLSNQPEVKVEPVATSDLSGVGRGSADDFLWLTRHHAYITVYLVSVLHSVQAGLTDKALSYVDRALQLINQEIVSTVRPSGVLGVLKIHVLEQSVQCLLMRGETANATAQLQELVDVCHAHPVLVYSHRAVLHTLLGLYAFATGSLERATAQLQTALQHTNCRELRILVSLNLAICFMKMGEGKETELAALMTSVTSEATGITCQSLQSALSYVRGLFSFTSGRLHDAKRQLRETLAVANGSDLNKLTSCSLLLLGQIFMALGNNKETLDMVTPALQLAVKMPENRLHVWAASLLADLYRTLGQSENEQAVRRQSSVVACQLEKDQKKALECKAHQLVQWTIGEWPVTATPPPEVRGQEVAVSTPPRRSSITVNGSPVVLKTPEIVLKKVESPSRATPPRSLLAMANKSQATPIRPQTPPNSAERRKEAEVGEKQGGREGLSNHTPGGARDHQLSSSPLPESLHRAPLSQQTRRNASTPNQDTSYHPPTHPHPLSHDTSNQDTPYSRRNQDTSYPQTYQDTQQNQVSSSYPQTYQDTQDNQDTSCPQTNQDISHLLCRAPLHETFQRPNHEVSGTPAHFDSQHSVPRSVAPSPPRPVQSIQSRYGVHPPANQMSPHLHSSPTLSRSPHLPSSPAHSPLPPPPQQYHRHTPPHFIPQEGPPPHHLNQPPPPPPSYEHSIQTRTPPPMPGASPSGPRSPQLHHLSPSHTPPPSRLHTQSTHTEPTHVSPIELQMHQQRLLWERQKYLQAQQRARQTGGYIISPHGIGLNTAQHGISPQHGIIPNTAQHGMIPNTAQHGIIANTAQHGIIPNTAQHGISLNTARHGISLNTAQHGIIPNTAQHGISPQHGIIPNTAQLGISPSPARHYQMQSLTPSHLSHMAYLGQLPHGASRHPSPHSHLLPGHLPPHPHQYGHQHR